VFDNAWHNTGLPCDVDRSGLVDAADVQLLVSSLGDHGFYRIDSIQDENPYAMDVSNDGIVTPLDVLRVINVLNAFREPLTIEANPPEEDLDRNGIVLTERITVSGGTSPGARVSASIDNLTLVSVDADAQGAYELALAIPLGTSEVALVATDPRGRSETTPLIVRRGDTIHNWNASLLNVIRNWGQASGIATDDGLKVRSTPPHVARSLAMLHAAMFDAVNQFEGRFTSYIDGPAAPATVASPVAAAAGAAYAVAQHLYPGDTALTIWNSTLNESLATVTDLAARQQGFEFGKSVGEAMLMQRAADGAAAGSSYQSGSAPGAWRPTYPNFQAALLPQWPEVSPFVVQSVAAFRPAPPPPLTSPAYAEAVDEVMRLGGIESAERSPAQTAIAQFWADGAGTATPPGHWNRIATGVTLSGTHSLLENARLFALLNLALADAGIASWDAKYVYDLWRPIDAIQRADEDGNPETVADAAWRPLLSTPPFSAYTSGHSTFSAAAAEVLTLVLGEDVDFIATPDPHTASPYRPVLNQQRRSFANFRQAAAEAGQSRIYGGVHFSFDNSAGVQAGKAVGAAVVATALLATERDNA
jgi:hypothetical protein